MALTKAQKRTPDRTKSSASLSVSWATYDKLDKLAEDENASLSQVVDGLVDHFYKSDSDKPASESDLEIEGGRRPIVE